MSFSNLDRVGITTRSRKRNVSGQAVAATIATVLGVSTPGAAAARPFKMTTVEAKPSEWTLLSNDVSVAPIEIDAAPVVEATPHRDFSDTLSLARAVQQALPIDSDADRRIAAAMRKRSDGLVAKKLSKKK